MLPGNAPSIAGRRNLRRNESSALNASLARTGSATSAPPIKHAWYGISLLLLLVLTANLAGRLFPHQTKHKPVPTHRRTFCKQHPVDFDPDQAHGVRALITGAAGFLGSHLARYCSEELLMDVVGLDRRGTGANNLQFTGDIRIVTGDLTNATFVGALFAKYKFDVVYHTMSHAAEDAHASALAPYTTVLVGAVNLINEAARHNGTRFTLTSSAAVYGAAQAPWAESTRPEPISPLGISKLAVEHHLAAMAQQSPFEYYVLRMHSLYGPRMDLGASQPTTLARVVSQGLAGTRVSVRGDGSDTRQYTFVEDVVPLTAAAPFTLPSGTVVNVGSEELTTEGEVLSHAERVLGRPLLVKRTSEFAHTVPHAQVVHDLSHCLSRSLPSTPFEEGIRQTIEWANSTQVAAVAEGDVKAGSVAVIPAVDAE